MCWGTGIFILQNFNPRSREGSDNWDRYIVCVAQYFNPRSREGSDTTSQQMLQSERISIHAPAKGATICKALFYTIILFQSTLPRRERLYKSLYIHLIVNFNPRSREGSDGIVFHHHYCWINFNPRSREGSDTVSSYIASACIRFQSTLPRRERRRFEKICKSSTNFNPRSREGSDYLLTAVSSSSSISIHAPAKGATFS